MAQSVQTFTSSYLKYKNSNLLPANTNQAPIRELPKGIQWNNWPSIMSPLSRILQYPRED